MIKKIIILILVLLIFFLICLIKNRIFGFKLNLYRKHNTLNYWMNSLKYDRLNEKKLLVDKYKSKLFIQKHFPEIKVIKTLHIYENPKDIYNINLPKYCVIKETMGSGRYIIITPKKIISKKNIEKKTSLWLLLKFGNKILPYYSEPQYNAKNRIIIEEYMGDLFDYKFFVIKGKISFVQCDIDRFSDHRRNLYDENWNLLDFEKEIPNSKKKIVKPKTYEKMKEFCYKFYNKTKFDFVRIDLYEINGKIYFGEFTFTPENCLGKFTKNYDKKLYNKYVKNTY